jgi:Thioredoxin domain
MLNIEIIGTENNKQKALVNRVKQAVELMKIEATISEITDWEEIMNYDIIQTPALVIRNQVLSQGFVPHITDLKILIAAFLPDTKKKIEKYYITILKSPNHTNNENTLDTYRFFRCR